MPPRTLHIAAACLFDPAGRLLLVRKRGTRMFMLPGGKREHAETPLQALLRELDEELSLQLTASALTTLGHFNEVAANEPDTRVAADIFRGVLAHPVQPAAELEELRWLSAGEPHGDDLAPLLRHHVLPRIWPTA